MKALYRHLNWNDWHLKHHIDHHLGRLTQRRYEALVQGKNVEKESIPVYTPIAGSSANFRPSPTLRSQVDPNQILQRCQECRPQRRSILCRPRASSQWHKLRRDGHASSGRSHGQRTRWLRSNRGRRSDRPAQLCEKAMRFPGLIQRLRTDNSASSSKPGSSPGKLKPS